MRGPKRPYGVTRAKVLEMHRAGAYAKDIAATLGISTQVVYYHIGRKQETNVKMGRPATVRAADVISAADAVRYREALRAT